MGGKPPPPKSAPKAKVTVVTGPRAAKEMAAMEREAAKEKAAKGKRG